MIDSAAELARAIYERQRQGRFAREDRPMPPWEQIPPQERRDRVTRARQLQSQYHRVEAREVPLTLGSPAR